MKLKTIVCLSALLILAPLLRAQDTLSIKLKEITIKGIHRIESAAVTKTRIDSVEIAQSASGSLSELISKSTPVFVKTYGQGSTATVSFRGTGASHTQVTWNGININNPMLGQVDLSLIPVWFIDQVELYHGGSSLQKGSGALGGTISMNSLPDWNKPYRATVVQGFGSFGKYQTFVSAGGGNRKVQGNVRYLYEQAENDFSFINTAIPPFERIKQQNAQYRKHGIEADLYTYLGKGNFLSVNAWVVLNNRNIPTIMSYEGLGRKEHENSNDVRIAGKWGKFWRNVRSEYTFGYSRTDMDYTLENKTYLGWVVNTRSNSKTNSFFNKYNVDWEIGSKSVLKFALNADVHDVSTLNQITLEGYKASRVESGLSASFHHVFNPTFSGYVLLREDLYDDKFSPIMPSLGLEANLLKDRSLSLKLNGVRNYHQPTLNDLYWLPGGNPDLRPEKGYSGDLSIAYQKSWGAVSGNFSATGFLSRINDWIIWQPSEFMYWRAENIKTVFSRGIEVAFSVEGSWSGVRLGLNGNYALTRTTNESDASDFDDSAGKQLIYVPLHKANALFSAGYKGFYLDFLWAFTSERYTTSSNESTRHVLPYYSLCDLTIGKKFAWGNSAAVKGIDLQLKINNLFDIDYQAILWRAMPGINFQFQIKFTL